MRWRWLGGRRVAMILQWNWTVILWELVETVWMNEHNSHSDESTLSHRIFFNFFFLFEDIEEHSRVSRHWAPNCSICICMETCKLLQTSICQINIIKFIFQIMMHCWVTVMFWQTSTQHSRWHCGLWWNSDRRHHRVQELCEVNKRSLGDL